jgi:hypothetical protein
MHPLTPLRADDFDALIERTANHRRVMVHKGEILLLTPPAKLLPDGEWREPILLGIDAVLVAVSDELAGQRGLARAAVTGALPMLQMDVINQVNRADDIWIGLVEREVPYAKQARHGYAVMAGTPLEIRSEASFLQLPGTRAAWFASLRRAVETVRERARKPKIQLPERFALETDEARELIKAHIAARQSPSRSSRRH